jgi:hypothetical protein
MDGTVTTLEDAIAAARRLLGQQKG